MRRHPAVPSVGATNWAGGVAATEHLIGLGHQRIAVIGGPTDVLCSRARVDGYRAAMNAAGLKMPAGYVRTGDFLSPTGYRETLVLLSQPKPPTAIFVCADQMALGAYEALYERGLRVPDDVSIVGFDDLEEARWGIPPLTTVRQPLAGDGRHGYPDAALADRRRGTGHPAGRVVHLPGRPLQHRPAQPSDLTGPSSSAWSTSGSPR